MIGIFTNLLIVVVILAVVWKLGIAKILPTHPHYATVRAGFCLFCAGVLISMLYGFNDLAWWPLWQRQGWGL